MLYPADLIFDDNRLILLDDEPACSHEDTSLKLFIFLAARLEGQMGDLNLVSSAVPLDAAKTGTNRHFQTVSTLPLSFDPVLLPMLE
jgi:hypothetical protein